MRNLVYLLGSSSYYMLWSVISETSVSRNRSKAALPKEPVPPVIRRVFFVNIKFSLIEKCYFKYLYKKIYQSIDFGDKESMLYSLTKKDYLKLKENK